MNVSDHQQKHLQAIKTKEFAAATAKFKANRRRRSLLNREEYEASNLYNSSMEFGAEYHAQELAAVPFVWESTPGTPKRHFPMINNNSSSSLPPLTPPPSFQYQNNNNTVRKKQSLKDSGVNNLIQSLLPRLSFKRDHYYIPPRLSSSSSTKSSSSPSSSSPSSLSSSSSSSQLQNVVSTPSPVQRLVADEEEEEEEVGSSIGGSSPVSALCFRRLSCFNRMFRGLQ